MRAIVIGTLVFSSLTLVAQQFQLEMADGELSGPFEVREGEMLTIGSEKVRVVNVTPLAQQLRDRMDGIIIPNVEFEDASIRDVVEFLQQASAEFDPQKRGVNIAIDRRVRSGSDSSPDRLENSGRLSVITLSAQRISLLQTLEIVTDVAGLKYTINDGGVIVIPLDAAEGEIIYREYTVLPSFYCRLTAFEQEERVDNLKGFFGQFGVFWPKGSSCKYLPGVGALFVSNTRANLEELEEVLGMLMVLPRQIEIEVSFVAFDRELLSGLGARGITGESLMTLWTNGHAEVLAAPRALTKSGARVTIDGVTAHMYPTEFDADSTRSTNAAVNASALKSWSLGTRDVGATLSVHPELSPDGHLVEVAVTSSLLEPPAWRDYHVTSTNGADSVTHVRIPLPAFHAYSANSRVTVAAGHAVLIGGGMPTRDRKRAVYIFLTVNLVDIRGKRIPARQGRLEQLQ